MKGNVLAMHMQQAMKYGKTLEPVLNDIDTLTHSPSCTYHFNLIRRLHLSTCQLLASIFSSSRPRVRLPDCYFFSRSQADNKQFAYLSAPLHFVFDDAICIGRFCLDLTSFKVIHSGLRTRQSGYSSKTENGTDV